ncbi:phosphotransferase enzyme family protein [Oharaeibacter diazotrophicus]|uniref:Ser/Thr protein kinase RdoA (MazF antagonist) n=1 Tax=Oharaeibacter diazotrophicus TaxID=1920512 RepID=A0A4V3CWP9_9HYPH|nr:phosphotransferase enzyme family protein [Oharaeibacter diazotrophicus]TDP87188.1 Ser/Thr protein kinase RdoA (MazF antagonist) [Oharaeibacter diazotrophicus]BBE70869.1 serine/threonine protein kinase [Pleomorphomonas sp. SM30]GLS77618.1 aminoglycoside phosphotransferase [Oharaeibacter diazotrophicus]
MLYQDAFLARLEAGVRGALPAWGVGADAAVRLLTISENATYLVDDGGRRLVVRVHRPDYHTAAEIASELAWISSLRETGTIETPRPIPGLDGTLLRHFDDGGARRHVVAFEFMAGKEPDASDDLPRWYRELGAISARLHRHARGFAPPDGFVRKAWTFDTIVGDGAYWGDWRAGLGLRDDGRALLQRTADRLAAETAAYGAGPDRFGLVHCDMRPANLLVEGDRLGVIDFDDCGFSWFVYDFAAAVSFQEHEPYIPELIDAWTSGYRSVAPLSAEDEAAIPMFVMLRRLQLTAWIASHAETPTAEAMGPAYTDGTLALAERYLSARP